MIVKTILASEFLNGLEEQLTRKEKRLYSIAKLSIAEQIKMYRRLYNLTQEELARKLLISVEELERIENCSEDLKLSQLAKIAAELKGKLEISLGVLETKK
jgi:predicted transcriptional regulator